MNISALMVTGDIRRVPLARLAVRNFLQQTYPYPHELVIVNHGAAPIMQTPHCTVREMMVPRTNQRIGDLRNIGRSAAQYPWIAQWDDDDIPAQDYLLYLARHARADTVLRLRTHLTWDMTRNCAFYKHLPQGHPGPLFFHNQSAPLYRSLMVGEDHALASAMRIRVLANDFGLYIRTYHGYNTLHRNDIMRPVPQNSLNVSAEHAKLLKEIQADLLSVGFAAA